MTNITLTDEEAKLFLMFRQHQDSFTVLLANGIFDMKNGSIIIHYDSNGLVRKIETHQIKFST